MRINPFYVLDFSAGAAISVMVVVNAKLGVATTIGTATIINQISGVLILSLLAFFFRHNATLVPKRQSAPWYLWWNGLFGIPILMLNSLTVIKIGAALAMAATVFGQSLLSFIFDLTGFMHMEKRLFSKQKLLSLSVSLVGILVMGLGSDTLDIASILLAMLAGALTITQMVLNSTFAAMKGPLFAARHNNLVGFFGSLLFFLLTDKGTVQGLQTSLSLPFLLLIAGGACGSYITTATNIAIRKVPAIHSSLLMASAQVLMSLVLDGKLSIPLFLGALLMLFGMGLSLTRSDNAQKTPRQDRPSPKR